MNRKKQTRCAPEMTTRVLQVASVPDASNAASINACSLGISAFIHVTARNLVQWHRGVFEFNLSAYSLLVSRP